MSPPVPFVLGGRDRRGWDCWGLLRCVYAEQYGIELPRLAGEYESVEDYEAIGSLYRSEVSEWQQVDRPRDGDALWMRILGQPCHVGVWVTGPAVLHVLIGTGTRIDRIDRPGWSRRISACYRHRALFTP